MNDKVAAFSAALRKHRVGRLWTQKQGGEAFGISRQVYIALELGRMPSRNLQAHYARVLCELAPPLAALFATAVGRPLEQMVVHVRPATVATVDASVARPAIHAALYKVAEDYEIAPAIVRRLTADVLEQLVGAGVSIAQAAEIVRAAVKESGREPRSEAGKRSKGAG